jgi:lipopolysaccharide export LptBFGC system permease protein LptF
LRRLILAVLYLAMMLASVCLSLIFYRRGGRSIILASIAFAAFGAYLF